MDDQLYNQKKNSPAAFCDRGTGAHTLMLQLQQLCKPCGSQRKP